MGVLFLKKRALKACKIYSIYELVYNYVLTLKVCLCFAENHVVTPYSSLYSFLDEQRIRIDFRVRSSRFLSQARCSYQCLFRASFSGFQYCYWFPFCFLMKFYHKVELMAFQIYWTNCFWLLHFFHIAKKSINHTYSILHYSYESL